MHQALAPVFAPDEAEGAAPGDGGRPPPAGAPRPRPGRQPTRPEHILVAEDNVVNQRVLLTQLRGLGFQAQAVTNGHEVLEALAHGKFSLVLMDCHMPGMDGLETTREIRHREQEAAPAGSERPYVPILALTADVLLENRIRCAQAGMDDFLTKPVRKEELLDALAHWLPATEKE